MCGNTNKFSRMMEFAGEQSLMSPVQYKHGAVIFQGKKPICFGYNTNTRTTYMKNIVCSVHAEMDVLVKFLNSFIKIHNTKSNAHKTRRKLKKYSMCVVRTIERSDGSIEYLNSSPCKDCLMKLKMVGLNKLSYSTGIMDELFNNKISRFCDTTAKFSQTMAQPKLIDHMRMSNLLR
jgi:deoxycytidylate deaminase